METSKVYFTNLRTTPTSNLLDKMERLVKRAGIEKIPFKDNFVAIKIHFGEPGNLAYIRPNYAARMANVLRNLGAKPFLTDCNTLYSGHRGPVMSGFRKYYTILTGCEPDAYNLDADTKLTVMEQNMPRDIGYLSAGKQDLVGVCMRMALVEAMYKEEKPFLIFDDPFVNLDDNNIKGAMKLLDEIAKNYQVIYFTCSESRIHN